MATKTKGKLHTGIRHARDSYEVLFEIEVHISKKGVCMCSIFSGSNWAIFGAWRAYPKPKTGGPSTLNPEPCVQSDAKRNHGPVSFLGTPYLLKRHPMENQPPLWTRISYFKTRPTGRSLTRGSQTRFFAEVRHRGLGRASAQRLRRALAWGPREWRPRGLEGVSLARDMAQTNFCGDTEGPGQTVLGGYGFQLGAISHINSQGAFRGNPPVSLVLPVSLLVGFPETNAPPFLSNG